MVNSSRHIKTKQYEQGSGILEGMVEDFPERSTALREQVGDIRLMQKDYTSALWNYTQILMIDSMRLDIKNKINKVRILHHRQATKP